MKSLILSISTGQGHHATGHAIKDEFDKRGVDCEILDAYAYIEPILSYLVSKGYLLSTAYAKTISSKLYDIVVKKNKPLKIISRPKITNTVRRRDLKEYPRKANTVSDPSAPMYCRPYSGSSHAGKTSG
jgi:processive 1,2-diacylglycerol beta-glucosyltransferase